MSLPKPVRYYHAPRAPNPRRVQIFLDEKGIELEWVNLNLMEGDHKQPDYVAKTGSPQVPALELEDGTFLVESPTICRYLEAVHPDPNMLGRDPMEEAVIDMWQRRIELRLMVTIAQAFRHTNPHMAVLEDQCADWGQVNMGRIDSRLAELDRQLQGPPMDGRRPADNRRHHRRRRSRLPAPDQAPDPRRYDGAERLARTDEGAPVDGAEVRFP